jgi:PleD family two-component response regulator
MTTAKRQNDSVLALAASVLNSKLEYALGTPATRPSADRRQDRENSRCVILVVDEDLGERVVMAESLTRSGYYVDMAKDGVDAWNTLTVRSQHSLTLRRDESQTSH